MKNKIRIVVSSPENVNNEVNKGRSAELLLQEYPELAADHQAFLLLLSVITKDLQEKRKDIKAAREEEKKLTKTERSLATVQMFLYSKYLLRIEDFRRITEVSLVKMANQWAEGEDVTKRKDKHQAILRTIRRRMKSLMDVTDKYSVGNIFTGLGLLAGVNKSLGDDGPELGMSRNTSNIERSTAGASGANCRNGGQEESSFLSTDTDSFGDLGITRSSSFSLSASGDWIEERPNTLPRRRSSFHCVADTVAVLTKSYHLKTK